MNVTAMFRRLALTGVASVAAFASGAASDPAPAGAHCGGHSNSCGFTYSYSYSTCDGPYRVDVYDVYDNDCSGTCYNGGSSGCCDSPEACADAPCKPGGCGGACNYAGSQGFYNGWC